MDSARRFVQEYRCGFRILRQDTDVGKELLEALLPDPDRSFEGAKIFKPGSRTHAALVTLAGRQYFLKRYNCRGWLYRLQNAFRRSRAVRTWHTTWRFVANGVPVPTPLLCLEERRFRLLGRSYILMEFAAGKEQLAEVLPTLDGVGRKDLLVRLGAVLGKMHRRGCLHGDLKWSNILVGPPGEHGREVCLVDLDGSRIASQPDERLSRRDLRRFRRDLEAQASAEEQDCFCRSWQKSL